MTEERRMDEGVMGEKGNISAEHSQNSGVCESVSRKRQHARAGKQEPSPSLRNNGSLSHKGN